MVMQSVLTLHLGENDAPAPVVVSFKNKTISFKAECLPKDFCKTVGTVIFPTSAT
jgi:hypothetical protein